MNEVIGFVLGIIFIIIIHVSSTKERRGQC